MANARITVERGISEEDQECSFMNATLQGRGNVAFSVATYIDLGDDQLTENEVADRVAATLDAMISATLLLPVEVSFEVEVGPARVRS